MRVTPVNLEHMPQSAPPDSGPDWRTPDVLLQMEGFRIEDHSESVTILWSVSGSPRLAYWDRGGVTLDGEEWFEFGEKWLEDGEPDPWALADGLPRLSNIGDSHVLF